MEQLAIGRRVTALAGNDLVRGRAFEVCHQWGKGWEGEELYEVTFLGDSGGKCAMIGPFKQSELLAL